MPWERVIQTDEIVRIADKIMSAHCLLGLFWGIILCLGCNFGFCGRIIQKERLDAGKNCKSAEPHNT